MGNAVEEGPDVEVEHPVLLPTALSSKSQCVMGTSPRTIAIAVRMEDRLQLLFEQHRCCGFGHSVCHIRHPEGPHPRSMILRYFHRPHRSGHVAACAHPI